jgi:hypothetical protein
VCWCVGVLPWLPALQNCANQTDTPAHRHTGSPVVVGALAMRGADVGAYDLGYPSLCLLGAISAELTLRAI